MAWAENILFESPGFRLEVPKWDFPESGITCVWGASGSGKTTLLQVVSGMVPSPGFKLSVGGELISELPSRERNVGFVFQDYALFPHLTVWENIAFPALAKNIPREIWNENAQDLLKRLGLEKIAGQNAATLSGGESQRVALARALVTKPRLVCLDEPLSALDEKIRDDARQIILDLNSRYQVPFILVTHDIRDVRALSRSVMILSDGRRVTSGDTQTVLRFPESLEAALLIPENQAIRVSLTDGKCFLTGMEIPVTHRKGASRTALIAKNWAFEANPANGKQSQILGELKSIVDEGPLRSCVIKIADGQLLRAWSRMDISFARVGEPISLNIDSNGLILFEKR
jgi:ABC-type Fe3+/spermidine/putrescine transport system ATPase subunit